MAGKWFLRDWLAPQRVVVGVLRDVHRSGGVLGDDDTNLEISPDAAHQELLVNRNGVTNPEGVFGGVPDRYLECEINVGSDWRDEYEAWARSLVGGEVTAQGVWVDDDGHDSKTELHPMDVIFGSVAASLSPQGDWIGAFATERGLTIGQSLLAFRFAAASDDRAGVVQEGPPLAQWDRWVTFSLPLPGQPPPGAVAAHEHRVALAHHAADIHIFEDSPGAAMLSVSIRCNGRDYDGPGVILGEIVTFWTSATIPQIVVAPVDLSFGLVDVGSESVRHVGIQNAGAVALVVTVPANAPASPFQWSPLAATTVAPGTSLDVMVTFDPPGAGDAHGTLSVQSNAPGSPHSVTLRGRGRKVGPPL